jgi:hypothetical protein
LTDERDRNAAHCRSKFVRAPMSFPAQTSFVVRYTLRSPRLAPGHYRLIVHASSGSTVMCWVEQIDACRISAGSPFIPNGVLDDVRGAIVPSFDVSCDLE